MPGLTWYGRALNIKTILYVTAPGGVAKSNIVSLRMLAVEAACDVYRLSEAYKNGLTSFLTPLSCHPHHHSILSLLTPLHLLTHLHAWRVASFSITHFHYQALQSTTILYHTT